MTLRNPLADIKPEKEPLTRFRLLLAGAILGGVLLCSTIILAGTWLSDLGRRPEQQRLEALAPLKSLCLGGAGQAGAAGYQDGTGPHGLVVFRSNIPGSTDLTTFYNRTEDYPAEWQAAGLAQAELVACIQAGSAVVEECTYTLAGGAQATLQRVQLTASIELLDARTGARIGQGTLAGAEPRACRQQEQFAEGHLTQSILGEAVTPAQIQGWLRNYLE